MPSLRAMAASVSRRPRWPSSANSNTLRSALFSGGHVEDSASDSNAFRCSASSTTRYRFLISCARVPVNSRFKQPQDCVAPDRKAGARIHFSEPQSQRHHQWTTSFLDIFSPTMTSRPNRMPDKSFKNLLLVLSRVKQPHDLDDPSRRVWPLGHPSFPQSHLQNQQDTPLTFLRGPTTSQRPSFFPVRSISGLLLFRGTHPCLMFTLSHTGTFSA